MTSVFWISLPCFFFFSFQMLLGGGEASWEERRACSQPTTYRSYDQRLTLTAWNVTLTLGHYIDLYIRTTGAHVDRNKTLMADDSVTCIETLKITASKESFCFFLEGEGARTNGTTIFFFHVERWITGRSEKSGAAGLIEGDRQYWLLGSTPHRQQEMRLQLEQGVAYLNLLAGSTVKHFEGTFSCTQTSLQ